LTPLARSAIDKKGWFAGIFRQIFAARFIPLTLTYPLKSTTLAY